MNTNWKQKILPLALSTTLLFTSQSMTALAASESAGGSEPLAQTQEITDFVTKTQAQITPAAETESQTQERFVDESESQELSADETEAEVTGNLLGSGTCGAVEGVDNLTWKVYDTKPEDEVVAGDTLVIEGTGAMKDWKFSDARPWDTWKTTLTTLKLEAGMTTIGDYAFYEYDGLTGTLTIPAGVTSIGDWAFAYCSKLTGTLKLPVGVTSIGDGAFFYCSKLTGTLELPAGLTSIGERAFTYCSGLDGKLFLPSGVTSIGKSAFERCTKLTGELVIPDSVTKIEKYTFLNCAGFNETLTIPNSVTSIGANAFSNCTGLTGDLNIPASVTEIGGGAFSGCSGLNGKLTLSKGLTRIGMQAFESCSKLTGELVIPDGVTSIEFGAFYGCSGLNRSVIISESVTSIGNYAFNGLSASATIYNLSNCTLPEGEYGSATLGTCFTVERRFPNGSTKTSKVAPKEALDIAPMFPLAQDTKEAGASYLWYSDDAYTQTLQTPFEITKDATYYGVKDFTDEDGITVTFSPQKGVYTGEPVAFADILTVAEIGAGGQEEGETEPADYILTENTDYTFEITSTDGEGTSAGTKTGTVTLTLTGDGMYQGTRTATYEILPTTMALGNETISANQLSYVYGEAITVTAVPQMTGVAKEEAASAQRAELAAETAYAEPNAAQMAVYYEKPDHTRTQLSAPADPDKDGVYTMTLASEELLHMEGTALNQPIPLLARFVGDENRETEDGVFTVTVTPIELSIETEPTVKEGTSISYGTALKQLLLQPSTVKVKQTGEEVKGIFDWCKPDFVPNAGTYQAEWQFVPNDFFYAAYTGTLPLTVAKVTPTVTLPNPVTADYQQNAVLKDLALSGGSASWSVGGEQMAVPGTFRWQTPETPLAAGSSTTYPVVFTPTDETNYNTVIVDVTVTVNKAAEAETLKKGTTFTVDNVTYKVTSKENVAFVKSGASAKTVTIPDAIEQNGMTYKVTSIAANAFKNNKKITKVTMGSNITTIGSSAFSGCTKLKTLTLGKNVTTIGAKAFYKCTALTKVTIPSKVKTIKKQAFYGCKKLKSITIKTTRLTTKNVGSKAFKGIQAKATIKVPKSKLNTYRKLLKAKGVSTKAKIKK